MRSKATRISALVATLVPAVTLAAEEAATGTASVLTRGAMNGERAADYATGLLLVFALLALLAWAARWLQSRNAFSRGGMRVQSSIGLGGKERLMVVDVDGERLLIGVAPGGVSLIRALGTPEDTGEGGPAQSWLARTLSKENGS